MLTNDEAVPTAQPNDATFRVSWDIVEEYLDGPQVTVRIRSIPVTAIMADSSDGIPSEIDRDVSVRNTIDVPVTISSTDTTIDNFVLTSIEQALVLTKLVHLGERHGFSNMMDMPFAFGLDGERDPNAVRFLVLRWRAFRKWFLSLGTFDFAEMRTMLKDQPFNIREGAMLFLKQLAAVVPCLEPYDDIPSLLLEF